MNDVETLMITISVVDDGVLQIQSRPNPRLSQCHKVWMERCFSHTHRKALPWGWQAKASRVLVGGQLAIESIEELITVLPWE